MVLPSDVPQCSFCGAKCPDPRTVVADSENLAICSNCVDLCVEVLAEKNEAEPLTLAQEVKVRKRLERLASQLDVRLVQVMPSIDTMARARDFQAARILARQLLLDLCEALTLRQLLVLRPVLSEWPMDDQTFLNFVMEHNPDARAVLAGIAAEWPLDQLPPSTGAFTPEALARLRDAMQRLAELLKADL